MSRVSETDKLIDRMNDALQNGNVTIDAIIGTFLGNMAESLAVIADEMKAKRNEQENQEKETK